MTSVLIDGFRVFVPVVDVEVVDLGVLHRLEVLLRLQLRSRRLSVQPEKKAREERDGWRDDCPSRVNKNSGDRCRFFAAFVSSLRFLPSFHGLHFIDLSHDYKCSTPTRAKFASHKVCLEPKFASMADFEDRMMVRKFWYCRTANRGL